MNIIFAVYMLVMVNGSPVPRTLETPVPTYEACLQMVASFLRDGPKPEGPVIEVGAACILQPAEGRPA
jgi:hypothetical protein